MMSLGDAVIDAQGRVSAPPAVTPEAVRATILAQIGGLPPGTDVAQWLGNELIGERVRVWAQQSLLWELWTVVTGETYDIAVARGILGANLVDYIAAKRAELVSATQEAQQERDQALAIVESLSDEVLSLTPYKEGIERISAKYGVEAGAIEATLDEYVTASEERKGQLDHMLARKEAFEQFVSQYWSQDQWGGKDVFQVVGEQIAKRWPQPQDSRGKNG